MFLQIARCRCPGVTEAGNEDSGELFAYKTGRAIATARLRQADPYDIIPVAHPISHNLAYWFAGNYFDEPITLVRDHKGRWLSTFESEEIADTV